MASLKSKKSHCPTRPFHLWNPDLGRRLPSKFYSDRDRAKWGVLRLLLPKSRLGMTLKVLDVMSGQELATYVRKQQGIFIPKGDN